MYSISKGSHREQDILRSSGHHHRQYAGKYKTKLSGCPSGLRGTT